MTAPTKLEIESYKQQRQCCECAFREGAMWAETSIDEIEQRHVQALWDYIAKLERVRDAAKNMGLSCVNAGNYGFLGLSPGQCRCSTCSMREALDALEETKK